MMSNDMVDMCINAMVMNEKCQLMWISRPLSKTLRFHIPNSMHEWHSQHYKTSYKSIYMVCFHVNVLSMNSIYGSWHEVKDVEIIPNVILMHSYGLHSFHLWYKIPCMNFLLDYSAYNLHLTIMLYCSSKVGYVALILNGNQYKKVEFIKLENQQPIGLLLLGR